MGSKLYQSLSSILEKAKVQIKINEFSMIFNSKKDFFKLSIESFKDISPNDKAEYEQLLKLFRFPDIFKFPFILKEKRERPDFLIEYVNISIGIEVTYAAKQSWEEASQFLSTSKNDCINSISRNWFIDVDSKGKKIANMLKNKKFGDWIWSSKEQAKEKALEVINAIIKKSSIFNNPNFEKFNLNWLLITDKLPFLFLEISEFQPFLHQFLNGFKIPYNKVFFITQRVVKKKINLFLFEIENGLLRQKHISTHSEFHYYKGQ